MAHRNLLASKNLDVPETSHDPVTQAAKGSAGDSTLEPFLSVVCPFPAQPNRQREHRGCYRPLGSKYISATQATNHVEAVKFAKSIGVPLVAHLTIHWSGTGAWDDPDGTRFAKVREGLAKVLNRRSIPVAWVWCRECKNTPTSWIAICSFTCLWLEARCADGRPRAPGGTPRWRHLERVCGEAESLARSRRPLSAQRRWSRSMETISHQEEMARGARRHLRQSGAASARTSAPHLAFAHRCRPNSA